MTNKTNYSTFTERLNRIYSKANDAIKTGDTTAFKHYITILRGICVALQYTVIENISYNEVLYNINELEVYWGVCNE